MPNVLDVSQPILAVIRIADVILGHLNVTAAALENAVDQFCDGGAVVRAESGEPLLGNAVRGVAGAKDVRYMIVSA